MKYQYIDDGTKYLTFIDFIPIMDALDKLHAFGYVHSDVRLQNMCFPSNRDDKAKLIDFDLIARPSVKYPDGYNHFDERHPDAKAGRGRKFVHNRCSLHHMIENEVHLTTEQRNKCESWLHYASPFFVAVKFQG